MSRQKRPAAYSAVQAEIGKRILWARELVEPNGAAMAKAMGIDRSTLQKIENGTRAPSIFNVLDFAARLRLSTDYILRGSMQGVDGELAAMLVARHPELAPKGPWGGMPSTATDAGTSLTPKTPARRRAS
jgi:transcriptional regulator with XRE-family HTH domain